MTKPHDLPADLARFRDTYVELFGSMPPLPDAKFEFSSDIDPEFLRTAETLRAQAFSSTVFDVKTSQLLLFGMLLAAGAGAARFHAVAARRAGASWDELHQVVALATAVSALGPLNSGAALLNELRAHEPSTAAPSR